MKIYLQDSFIAEETVQTKLRFEKESATEWVYIKAYNTNNGVFTTEQFMKEVFENFQRTRRSGVGGHHYNGVAEKAIKDITRMSRTMMVHQALRWPKMADKSLWPLAFQHATFMNNHLPRTEHGWSPEELWTGTKSTRSELKNARPWDVPVMSWPLNFRMEPRFQSGIQGLEEECILAIHLSTPALWDS